MRRMINELGNKYSRLYVIALADERINGQAAWICECQCGGSRVVRGNLLRKGITRSCGCLVRERVAKQAPMAAAIRWGHA